MNEIERERMTAYLRDADDLTQKELLTLFRIDNIAFEIERRGIMQRECLSSIKNITEMRGLSL